MKEERKRSGYSIPLGGCSLVFNGPKWETPPLYWFRSAEKQQVKLVGNAAQ
jgi:hypothetical protein